MWERNASADSIRVEKERRIGKRGGLRARTRARLGTHHILSGWESSRCGILSEAPCSCCVCWSRAVTASGRPRVATVEARVGARVGAPVEVMGRAGSGADNGLDGGLGGGKADGRAAQLTCAAGATAAPSATARALLDCSPAVCPKPVAAAASPARAAGPAVSPPTARSWAWSAAPWQIAAAT